MVDDLAKTCLDYVGHGGVMLIHELAAAFLSAHQNTFLPNTQLAYAYDLRRFQRAFPDLDIRGITI
jgi:hypothetical protein